MDFSVRLILGYSGSFHNFLVQLFILLFYISPLMKAFHTTFINLFPSDIIQTFINAISESYLSDLFL